MTDTIIRHLKGTPGAGRFAKHTSPEPAITLTDIHWAREATGTDAAADPRYADVMAHVFAAASSAIAPDRELPADPKIAEHAAFATPAPAEVDGDGGWVSGGPDDLGLYAFTEENSREPFGAYLHHLTFTDPDNKPTPENYAASLAFIAGENHRDAMCRFFRSRANSAQAGADAADALAAAVHPAVTEQPRVAELLDEVDDLTRAVTAARRSGMDTYAEDMMRLNEKAMRAGVALSAALGYLQPPAEDE
jgi:hypothetical protein